MNEIKVEMRSEIAMFNKEFLDCNKDSIISVDTNNLKSYLFDLINTCATAKYNSMVKHGTEEFKYLTESMKVDKFCTRFYSYMLKLNNESDGYLDFKYMLWADIFANYISMPDNMTILEYLKDYCSDNDILIDDLIGEGITNSMEESYA